MAFNKETMESIMSNRKNCQFNCTQTMIKLSMYFITCKVVVAFGAGKGGV
jgi:hypothetical protein